MISLRWYETKRQMEWEHNIWPKDASSQVKSLPLWSYKVKLTTIVSVEKKIMNDPIYQAECIFVVVVVSVTAWESQIVTVCGLVRQSVILIRFQSAASLQCCGPVSA